MGVAWATQPVILPITLMGGTSVIRLGVIGCGRWGTSLICDAFACANAKVVALSDVDESHLNNAAQLFYDRGDYEVRTYRDFRELLSQSDIDAVIVATPNHWLALIAVLACRAGKDVFVETPASHTVYEGKVLLETATQYHRVAYVGVQNRLHSSIRKAIEWVKGGNLGKVKVARAICYRPRKSIGTQGPMPPPQELDYDMWTGPAPREPYGSANQHENWRFNQTKGNGELGNEAFHLIDLCRWALGKTQFPNKVTAIGARLGYNDMGNTPNTQLVMHEYSDVVLITEIRGLPHTKAQQASEDWNPCMDTFAGTSFGFVPRM